MDDEDVLFDVHDLTFLLGESFHLREAVGAVGAAGGVSVQEGFKALSGLHERLVVCGGFD